MFNPPLSDTHKTHFQSHDSGTHSHHCRSPATSSIYRVPDLVIHRWSATQSLSWARQNDNVCLWKPEKVRGSNPLKNRTPFCTVLVSKWVAKRAPSPSWKILVIGNHHQLFKSWKHIFNISSERNVAELLRAVRNRKSWPFSGSNGGKYPQESGGLVMFKISRMGHLPPPVYLCKSNTKMYLQNLQIPVSATSPSHHSDVVPHPAPSSDSRWPASGCVIRGVVSKLETPKSVVIIIFPMKIAIKWGFTIGYPPGKPRTPSTGAVETLLERGVDDLHSSPTQFHRKVGPFLSLHSISSWKSW